MWDPDMPMEYRNQIITGDARVLAERIPDESVDLIFTDPVYQNIDDYRWLAEMAARVLKPDRACLVFCGIEWLGESIAALQAGGLSYQWQLILSMPYRNGGHIKGGFSQYISCLWFRKGCGYPKRQIPDMRLWRPADGPFEWAKNPDFVAYYTAAFVGAGDIAFDPFVGLGTMPLVWKMMLGVDSIAFEINPATAERARERVRNTQPPLFVPEPEQMEMALV
jgi:DNA modification methylase